MTGRKRTHRKVNPERGNVFNTPEVVHVEHNLIVDWLLNIRHWVQKNRAYFRTMFVAAFISLMVAGMIIFLYSSLIKKQNYLFFKYAKQFDEFQSLKVEDEKKRKLTELKKNAHKLCRTFFKTSHSYNGCLVEAAALIEIGRADQASEPLELFGQKNAQNGAGAYVLFFAAQTYENLLRFDKAYAIYHQLEEILKPIKKEDIAVFNKGKILFLQDKITLAENVFEEMLDRFPNSKLIKDAHTFLNLIAFKRSKEFSENKIRPTSTQKKPSSE